jgi:sugar-specific transcriptional regulator TrmB
MLIGTQGVAMSPKTYLEELAARKAELREQLRQMQDHLVNPERSPTFGTHTNGVSDTEEAIQRIEAQIAETDRLIASVGNPDT